MSSSSGLCYRFSGERLSWSDARKECEKFDSILLRIYTAQDIVRLLHYVASVISVIVLVGHYTFNV